ncbi:metallophosphoesterase, partial [Campylobacter jejuni]
MIFLIFSFIVLLIFGLANVYIYKRLIKKITLFKYFYKIFAFIFILFFFAQLVFFIFFRVEFFS